jgi:hypothetical protein
LATETTGDEWFPKFQTDNEYFNSAYKYAKWSYIGIVPYLNIIGIILSTISHQMLKKMASDKKLRKNVTHEMIHKAENVGHIGGLASCWPLGFIIWPVAIIGALIRKSQGRRLLTIK